MSDPFDSNSHFCKIPQASPALRCSFDYFPRLMQTPEIRILQPFDAHFDLTVLALDVLGGRVKDFWFELNSSLRDLVVRDCIIIS